MEAQESSKSQTGAEEEPHAQDQDVEESRVQYDSDGLSAIDRQYAAQTDVPRRVHILGASGSIGKLVAHSLRGIANPPPITLVLHRYGLVKAWEQGKQEITLMQDGYEVPRSGYQIELQPEVRKQHGVEIEYPGPGVYDQSPGEQPHETARGEKQQQEEAKEDGQRYDPLAIEDEPLVRPVRGDLPGHRYVSQEPIHNLIIAVKAARTLTALGSIKHRLKPSSTICFLQNGMGMIDDVNKEIFPDEETRPNYMQGIITHGVNAPPRKVAQDPFYAVHAGLGTIALALLPRTKIKSSNAADKGLDSKDLQTEKWAPSSRFLLRTLTRSPVLCAVGFTPTELLQQQLEKLAVNSVLNTLTSLLDNRNGSLLYNFALTRTMRLMLAETSHVLRSLPELQGIPNVNLRFSPTRLETLCVSVANKTRGNISSMLADVRSGRKTEIEYINGYIVRRGEEMGIKCVVNYAMMQTVIGKAQMVNHERRDEVPSASSLGQE